MIQPAIAFIRSIATHLSKGWRLDAISAALLLAMAVAIEAPYLNEFPICVHAWTQSDHYALTLGFIDNGLDLFHPQMLAYNDSLVQRDTTITAVDCPLHDWFAALWMLLLGTTNPWVCRVWTLLVSLVGIFALYKAARLLTADWFKSFAVAVVALTAPTVAYYAAGFIPSMPAFACCCLAMWLYVAYLQKPRAGLYVGAWTALTLAVLMRTSLAVAWVALAAYETLRAVRHETPLGYRPATVALSLAVIIAYRLWNSHLAACYGSSFLTHIMPPDSWDGVEYIYRDVQNRWQFEYFQRKHHWLIALTAIATTIHCVVRRPRATEGRRPLSLWWLWTIWVLGASLFVAAMMRQYCDHDYYFIDSLMPPLLLGFALLLAEWPPLRNPGFSVVALLFLAWLSVASCVGARSSQQMRRQNDNLSRITYEHYKGADRWLDSLGVARDAKVMSLYAYPPQTPLILMGRKGVCLSSTNQATADAIPSFRHDCIVIEDSIVRVEFDSDATGPILRRLHRLEGNGQLSLCSLADTVVSPSLETFFQPLADE